MYHAEQGYLAATNECLTMYMDMDTRRSAVFSEAQQARFEMDGNAPKRWKRRRAWAVNWEYGAAEP